MKTLKWIVIQLLFLPLLAIGQWQTGETTIAYPLNEQEIQDIFLAYDNTFYAITKADFQIYLYKSVDEGYSWKEIKRFEDIDNLYFIDEFSQEFNTTNPVWITTGDMISYNLGDTWSHCNMHEIEFQHDGKYIFCDNKLGWFYADFKTSWGSSGGKILIKTTDAGVTWTEHLQSYSGNYSKITDLYFLNKKKGYLLGNDPDAYMACWEEDNYYREKISLLLWEFNDSTWTKLNALKINGLSDSLLLKDIEISSIEFINETMGWLAARNNECNFLYRTSDGGKTWNDISCSYHFIYDMQFLDKNEGWALSVCNNSPVLIYTSNRGLDWYAYNGVGVSEDDRLEVNENFGWIRNNDRNSNGALAMSNFFFIYNDQLVNKEYKRETFNQPDIYPNPFNHHTVIQLPDNSRINRIEIIDITGKTVKGITDIHKQKYTFQREGLKGGIYFLRVWGDKQYTGRILIQ